MRTFRQRLHGAQDCKTGHIVRIPSPAGAGCVILDGEHGAIGHVEPHAMIAAPQGCDCAPVVRVDRIVAATVKHVLDLGAEGIVFPLLRSARGARVALASSPGSTPCG